MEVERINQTTGMRIERTGSESERRRKRGERDFSDVLDQTLDEEHGGPGGERQDARQGVDTVSITGGANPQLAPADIVTISKEGQVGSQSIQATCGRIRLSIVQRLSESLKAGMEAREPAALHEEDGNAKPVDQHKPIDTVA